MKIIVLTAGLGTRLRPHTLTRPKALLTLAGRPMLAFIIDKLLECQKISPELEFIFVNGYLGDQIVDYVGREYVQSGRLRAQFVVQEQPLGQAHAIGLAREAVFAGDSDTDLMVVFADTLFDVDFEVLRHLPLEAAGALFTQEVADPSRFGVALLEDNTNLVYKVVEKPAEPISKLAICSPYYLKSARQLFGAIDLIIQQGKQTKGEFFLADAINQMLEDGARLQQIPMPVWLDAGTFEALLDTNRTMLDLMQSAHETNSVQSGPSNVFIQPIQIDASASIENSVIGPHVAIGKNAQIRNSVVADSIIEEGSQLNRVSLRHSIIGRFAHLNGPHAGENFSVGDYTEL